MKKMGDAERKLYISSQVAQIRPKLRLEELGSLLCKPHKDELARFLWMVRGAETFQILREYSGDRLVRIAACGLGENGGDGEETPLCFMSDELSMKWWGVDIVIKVASAAILAALTDRLWGEMERAKAEAAKPRRTKKLIKCKFCDYTTAKFARISGIPTSGFVILANHIATEHPGNMAEIENHMGEDVTEEV